MRFVFQILLPITKRHQSGRNYLISSLDRDIHTQNKYRSANIKSSIKVAYFYFLIFHFDLVLYLWIEHYFDERQRG